MNGLEIVALGFVIERGEHGRHTLTRWYREAHAPTTYRVEYEDMSWAEVADVIDAELQSHHVGYIIGDGWAQPPLFGA